MYNVRPGLPRTNAVVIIYNQFVLTRKVHDKEKVETNMRKHEVFMEY